MCNGPGLKRKTVNSMNPQCSCNTSFQTLKYQFSVTSVALLTNRVGVCLKYIL